MGDPQSTRRSDLPSGSLASDLPTRSLDPTAPPLPAGPGAVVAGLAAGRQFGGYRILRLLGRGGMGEVHEAEEIASGRRVALKVLNRALGEHERSRFLREGRLAAALSHPHTVYVYGTEEIDGVPAIAMELATGGTLKDRVHAAGPLPPREAVDLTRQIVAGLDAAARAGVLHRDVKPSNCFLDRDGRVKVGDFGLSISTATTVEETQLTMAGTVLGTPAFASPEQLRGGKLDVASDIYSVGATIYYLLTARAPFEEGNLVTLVANVLQDPPVAPSDRQPAVPRDLSAVVLRALAKAPADRFHSYQEFDAALRPFSSEAPAAATPGPRFLAGAIDTLAVSAAIMPLQVGVLATLALQSRWFAVLSWLFSFASYFAYYACLEGRWGATIGKRLAGLEVIAATGSRAGPRAIVVRTSLFLAVMQAPPLLLTLGVGPDFFLQARQGVTAVGAQLIMPVMVTISLAILFARARAANGYAALHDLHSSTRVVVRRPTASRTTRRFTPAPVGASPLSIRLGPYGIAADALRQPGAVIAAADDALHRPVWIRIAAADDPPIAADRRDLDRAARLRWIGGHRGGALGWDAFEAPDGVPLVAAPAVGADDWRRLLAQLASEIDAAARNGDLPPLSLARVWITDHGDVRLLDFVPPSPAVDLGAHDEGVDDWQDFLHRVAATLLAARDAPGPHARAEAPRPLFVSRFVQRLAAREFPTPAAAAAELAAIGDRPIAVSRARRAGHLAQLGVAPLFVLVCFFGFLVVIGRLSARYPGMELMRDAGEELQRLETAEPTAENIARRRAVEVLVAGRYAARLNDPAFRTAFFPRAFVLEEHGARLDRAAAAHAGVGGADLGAAEAALADFIARSNRSAGRLRSARGLASVVPTLVALLCLAIAAPTLVFAPLLRGGLSLRMWSIGVVDRSGREASRARALVRAVLAWTPLVALLIVTLVARRIVGPPDQSASYFAVTFALLALFAGGVVAAVVTPSRGLQDRLAGTWLVPR